MTTTQTKTAKLSARDEAILRELEGLREMLDRLAEAVAEHLDGAKR